MTDRFPLLKFAVFAVVCLGFAGWLVATIGNISLADRSTYQAEFADVSGLIPNAAVKISGVTVGKVTGIEVIPGGTAEVSFSVNDDVKLTRDTQVSVRWRGVLGLRYLYLEPGNGPDVDPGFRYPIAQTDAPADLGLLLQRLVPTMTALNPQLQNKVLHALQEALVGREGEVRKLIDDAAELTQTVASRDEEIRRLLENSVTVLKAYNQREEQLKSFIDSLADVSETLEARNDTLNRTITQLTEGMQVLGDFVDRNDEQIDALLDEAESVTDILAVNHENLREILKTGRGGIAYHYISRLGQWFNVNAVGVSFNEVPLTTTRGASLPPPQSDGPNDSDAAEEPPFRPSEDLPPPEEEPAPLRELLGAARGGGG